MFVEGVEDENQARENEAGTREVRAERNLEIIEIHDRGLLYQLLTEC
jgi:hypothetical protein